MLERIVTPRLVLEPFPVEAARAVLEGDLSSVRAGEGWPHDDTLDGLRITLGQGAEPGWLVTLAGVVIGDLGTHGPPDENGDVEIGYGLAAPYRGRGYGSELVSAASQWLLARPDVGRVVARKVLADNVPSRRALERAGLAIEREERGLTWYALGAVRSG